MARLLGQVHKDEYLSAALQGLAGIRRGCSARVLPSRLWPRECVGCGEMAGRCGRWVVPLLVHSVALLLTALLRCGLRQNHDGNAEPRSGAGQRVDDVEASLRGSSFAASSIHTTTTPSLRYGPCLPRTSVMRGQLRGSSYLPFRVSTLVPFRPTVASTPYQVLTYFNTPTFTFTHGNHHRTMAWL